MFQKRFKYLILFFMIICASVDLQAQDGQSAEKGQVIEKPAEPENKIEKPADPKVVKEKARVTDEPVSENEIKIEPKQTEKGAVKPEKADTVEKPKEKKKEEPKKDKDPKEQKALKDAEENIDKSGLAGLLSYNDENYKYSRIPELQIKDEKREHDSKLVTVSDSDESGKTGKDEKGLFGMSKSASDIFAKFSLIFLVIAVFLLYKSRSRKSVKKTSRYTK